MSNKILELKVTFLTPAFLGDAQQNGRWRTPPFKAQLRQWWRVAYYASCNGRVNVDDMRKEEGKLFGNAWLENDFCKSKVQLRLNQWNKGRRTTWQGLEQKTIFHPEVQRTQYKVAPHLYLGYGPLVTIQQHQQYITSLKWNSAINANESATLTLAYPQTQNDLIEHALWLMDRYGTVGGRSRNGWGSYILSPQNGDNNPLKGNVPLRNWIECLQVDWPHAIGMDEEGPLIWETDPHNDWRSLMRTLAIIKVGLRTQFVFPQGNPPPHQQALPRHWLSYPITRHTTRTFHRNARLPNSLRFKVRQASGGANGKVVGVIFHMPCRPPDAFQPQDNDIQQTWKTVHALLDELCKQPVERTYNMIVNAQRRNDLRGHGQGNQVQDRLDSIRLTRIRE